MIIHRFESEQKLPISKEEAWGFFSSPRNLEEMTPDWMGFRIVSLPSDQIFEGEIIEYEVRLFPGFWKRWISEIRGLREGVSFVDDQISGPFRYWHHLHEIREDGGGVVVKDVVHYSVGFWILGELIRKVAIGGMIARMFEHRRKLLTQKFIKSRSLDRLE